MAIPTRRYAIVFAPFDATRVGGFQMKGKSILLYPSVKSARDEAKRLDKLGITVGAYRVVGITLPIDTMVKE